MAKVIRFFDKYGIALAAAGVVLLLLAFVWLVWRSLPPREFTIATGREGGGYYQAAQAYQEFAAARGYTIHIRPTAGSVETLRLLESGEVDLGFVQGGVATGADPLVLSSVGSMYFEPLWIVYRKASFDEPIAYLDQLEGKRINLGEEGSGTKALAELMLEQTGVATDTTGISILPPDEAVAALAAGTVDAAFFVASPQAQVVREMLANPDLAVADVALAGAYAARLHFLSELVAPAGVVDLRARRPAQDVHLLATAANLVMRNDFHPDLLRLVVMAAVATHSPGGIFEQRYEFPNGLYTDLPVNPKVRAYQEQLKNGESILDNYLPFWAAALVDRHLLFVIPALLILAPILGRSPLVYQFYMRFKIPRWYRRVRAVEQSVSSMHHAEQFGEAYKALDDVDETLANSLRVAQFYMPDLYHLRTHVEYVRRQVQKREERVLGTAPEAPAAVAAGNGLPAAAGQPR